MKKKLVHFIRNKYALATVIFVFWIMFVNDIDVFYMIRSRLELRALTEEVEAMKRKNIEARQSLHDLSTNLATLE
ncbi:MAG: hypothetical protein ACK54P_07705, partial [Bacteroidota bacterium]